MNEEDGQLDKFLYGDEFSNVAEAKVTAAEHGNGEIKEEEEEYENEEEEEDDYEIILDSSKLPAGNASGTTDLSKRSLTSVAIGDGKGDEAGGEGGGSGADSSNPSGGSSSAPVSHFDPFAPANLNGLQIYDHDLENFEDKPWRKPGADLTDYFNFGFNEVTWRAYCVKQKALREEFGLQKKIGVYDSGANMSGSSVNTSGGSSGYANGQAGGNQSYNSYQSRPRRPPPPPPSSQMGYQNYHHSQQQPQQQDQRYPSYSRNEQAQQGGYQGQQGAYQGRPDQGQPGAYQGRTEQGQQGGYQGRTEYSRPPSVPLHHASRTRSRHEDSQSPPPPPPPSTAHSSRHEQHARDVGGASRSRSRSPEATRTRYVSTGRTRYDDTPRSPPNKRRRD